MPCQAENEAPVNIAKLQEFLRSGGSYHEVKGLIERDAIDLYTPRRHAFAPSVLDDYAVNLATFQLAAGHFGLVSLQAGEASAIKRVVAFDYRLG
jgi:hypothetical protein